MKVVVNATPLIALSLINQLELLNQLKKGTYSSVEQIIDHAFKLLQKQEQDYENWVNETRKKAEIGLKQLEKGEKVDGETVIAQLQEKFNRLRQ